ncbi:cellulose synthase [Burkholderia sp. Bp9126]|nr:cellulose synthase [Burkholderia sp. Bp9126]
MPTPTVLDIPLNQQFSLQWHGLLRALAAEFEAQLDHNDLRKLMFRIGERFAVEHPLSACESIRELAETLNARWAAIQWGYVELAAEPDYMRMTHYGAPLRSFGNTALSWTSAFLQGTYQAWFDAMGATDLTVTQVDVPVDDLAIEFRLMRLID